MIVVFLFILARHIFKNESRVTASIISPLAAITSQLPIKKQYDNSGLENAVKSALEGSRGIYGVALKNLKTGQTYYRDEHKAFDAASLYKVWIMATAFQQIADGKVKSDQILSQDVAVLNDKFKIASDAAELSEGRVSYKVEDALKQMITISHNYAALLLSEKVRLANVKSFLAAFGFSESAVGIPPKTTARDTALFFEKLYKGEIGNTESTQEMLELLKGQRLNNKIPKYLPKNVVTAHKTGEFGSFTHDAGIIYTPKGDYVIAVLSESNSPNGAEERIAQVSRAVYEYFINQNE